MMVRLATRKAHELREAVPPRITYMLLFGTVHYFRLLQIIVGMFEDERAIGHPIFAFS